MTPAPRYLCGEHGWTARPYLQKWRRVDGTVRHTPICRLCSIANAVFQQSTGRRLLNWRRRRRYALIREQEQLRRRRKRAAA